MSQSSTPAVQVEGLSVGIRMRSGDEAKVVDDVSFAVEVGGTIGLVGESGSGKTMTSLALVGLLPRSARITQGRILLQGRDITRLSQRALQKLRGSEITMILQDPMTALDPSFTIESQLHESLRQHRGLRGKELAEATTQALEQVQLPSAKSRLKQYPHQLSGGMRQRVTSAIALAGNPSVLIADEPTTALDVTTQARYLQLLKSLQQEFGFALILIAHDLLVVRHVCSVVCVMYAGQIVEYGPVEEVFDHPQHPYTRALIRAIPDLGDTIRLESIEGQAPDVSERIQGCRFAARCAYARAVCQTTEPALTPRGANRTARCFGTEEDGWVEF